MMIGVFGFESSDEYSQLIVANQRVKRRCIFSLSCSSLTLSQLSVSELNCSNEDIQFELNKSGNSNGHHHIYDETGAIKIPNVVNVQCILSNYHFIQ